MHYVPLSTSHSCGFPLFGKSVWYLLCLLYCNKRDASKFLQCQMQATILCQSTLDKRHQTTKEKRRWIAFFGNACLNALQSLDRQCSQRGQKQWKLNLWLFIFLRYRKGIKMVVVLIAWMISDFQDFWGSWFFWLTVIGKWIAVVLWLLWRSNNRSLCM